MKKKKQLFFFQKLKNSKKFQMNILPTIHDFEMEQCYRITCSILEHPIATIFSRPVNPIEDEIPDYFEKIKHPIDLGTIKTKLENKQYHNSEEWKNDITLVWSNAIDYNGNDSVIATAAKYLNDLFIDTVDIKIPESEKDWLFSIMHYLNKIKQIKNQTGNNYAVLHPVNSHNLDSETKKLIKALNSLNDEEDAIQITRILLLYEKDIKIDNEQTLASIDISTLSTDTIYMLICYAQRRFKELGKEYPQE